MGKENNALEESVEKIRKIFLIPLRENSSLREEGTRLMQGIESKRSRRYTKEWKGAGRITTIC